MPTNEYLKISIIFIYVTCWHPIPPHGRIVNHYETVICVIYKYITILPTNEESIENFFLCKPHKKDKYIYMALHMGKYNIEVFINFIEFYKS